MGIESTSPSETGDPGPMDADIRWWAQQNNVDCPPSGPIPADVRQLYLEAMAEPPRPPGV